MEPRTPLEVHDPARLEAVAALDLAADASDTRFDDLAGAAAGLIGAPLAFFTVVEADVCRYAGVAGLPAGADRFLPVEATFCKLLVAADQPLIFTDAATDRRTRDDLDVLSSGVRAWAGFPVRDGRGYVIGSFGVADVTARDWSAAELEGLRVLAQAASDQVQMREALGAERRARRDAEAAWVAAEGARLDLDRARRREHEVIDVIQRSLLPARLPAVPGMTTAVRFDASNDAADIGGDWYDVVAHGAGEASFVIGDVCGHDLPAIAAMARVRHYLHVLALREPDPMAVLAELDSLMLENDFERFATVALLRWESEGRHLRYVSAGHPPPLLLRADGTADLLLDGRRPPVNLGLAHATPEAGSVDLAPGDTIVLFTDGLFESATHDPEVGLDRLRAVALAAVGAAPDHLADALLAGMRPERGWTDDVAVLVARVS